jgi:hypothetical protein
MNLPRRSIATLVSALLVGVFVVAAAQAGGTPDKHARTAAAKYAVSVARCKDSALYDGREVSFRTRMTRLAADTEQRMEVKAVLYRKLNEAKKFTRVKLPGLSSPTTSKDAAATVYKRKITIRNVETAARYKLRTTFTWRNIESGKVVREKSVWSKVCRLKTGLPKLVVTDVASKPAGGTNAVTHEVTVKNRGASEALDFPVSIIDGGNVSATQLVESLAPGVTTKLTFSGLTCTRSPLAGVDPLKTLPRLTAASRVTVALPGCELGATG